MDVLSVTPSDIAKAREIIAAATPGPWDAEDNGFTDAWDVSVRGDFPIVADGMNAGNAKFTAAARTGWPKALDNYVIQVGISSTLFRENSKLRAENERLQKNQEKWFSDLEKSDADLNAEMNKLRAVAEAAEEYREVVEAIDMGLTPPEHDGYKQRHQKLFKALRAWRGEK